MSGSHISWDDSEWRISEVPDDFPRLRAEVIGLQPLFSSVAYNRGYCPPGCTPPEVHGRWVVFEEVAANVAMRIATDKHAKGSLARKGQLLADLVRRLLEADCGSVEEMRWVARRAASLAGFTAPESALPRAPAALPSPFDAWTLKSAPSKREVGGRHE